MPQSFIASHTHTDLRTIITTSYTTKPELVMIYSKQDIARVTSKDSLNLVITQSIMSSFTQTSHAHDITLYLTNLAITYVLLFTIHINCGDIYRHFQTDRLFYNITNPSILPVSSNDM